MTSNDFLTEIIKELKVFNHKAVDQICERLIESLYSIAGDFDSSSAEKILQQLRNQRLFDLMQKVGDALIQTGRGTPKINRLYAQALIDKNSLTAALSVLKELLAQTSDSDDENVEAKGLIGRVYKQLYINSKSPNIENNIDFLKKAILFYYEVYKNEPKSRVWHGINVVALLQRAETDQIEIEGFPAPQELAKSILSIIEKKHNEKKAYASDFATAAEASMALNKPTEALEWLSGYARMPYCDAFELASTLRQLEEVWQLDLNSDMGKLLLPLLRAELMKRQGGRLSISPTELRQQRLSEDFTSNEYKLLLSNGTSFNSKKLEKVFGDESFKTYKWYMKGASRCDAVARIGLDSSKGFGTGFLIKGEVLHKALEDDLILITNAHVISSNPSVQAIRPEEAVIIFEAIKRDEEFRNLKILWSSPSNLLDATILKFDNEDEIRIRKLTAHVDFYPVSQYLPAIDPNYSQHIYVIGHPYGGTLQLSFQDNLLLDHENHLIHYRTPTEGGSSGSPVFNQQWDLIGLHHSGDREMPCLNGKLGKYQANEGIWIQAIKEQLQKDL